MDVSDKKVQSRLLLLAYLAALVLHFAGTFTDYWAQAKFTIPVQPGVTQTLYGRSHCGIFKSVVTLSANTTHGIVAVGRYTQSKPGG
ncbi:hypothetical protein ElyMa_005569900 [Elysia marginata]|uniref:Reelin domain-containing protein n=1 Tax=Elysia marginata TaxID=1093978 RepID=A0AAV4F101_9GAST|nr:hypothetical protein ElyMa_005569900 [Elysia marginata]